MIKSGGSIAFFNAGIGQRKAEKDGKIHYRNAILYTGGGSNGPDGLFSADNPIYGEHLLEDIHPENIAGAVHVSPFYL